MGSGRSSISSEKDRSIAFATSWVPISTKGANLLLVGIGDT